MLYLQVGSNETREKITRLVGSVFACWCTWDGMGVGWVGDLLLTAVAQSNCLNASQ